MLSKTINVFFADDDEDDRILFEEALSDISSDIKLVSVEDGNKLIEALKAFNDLPTIIFLDLNMPNKNGKETLKEIRANKKYDLVPVVIYSTSTSDIDIQETYDSGATLYMEKPYEVSNMVNILTPIILRDWKKKTVISRNKYFISSKHKNVSID